MLRGRPAWKEKEEEKERESERLEGRRQVQRGRK